MFRDQRLIIVGQLPAQPFAKTADVPQKGAKADEIVIPNGPARRKTFPKIEHLGKIGAAVDKITVGHKIRIRGNQG